MPSTCGRRALWLVAVIVAGAWLNAQDQPATNAERASRQWRRGHVFRSGVELVNVTATVIDASGRLVAGLTTDDFQIYDDGVLQTITCFSRERVPLSLGIVLDISESMYGQRIADAQFALNRFLVDLLGPSDEVCLVLFNHQPELTANWTREPRQLSHQLDNMRPFGATAIYDAMVAAVPLFESRSYQRAAIVLISDGSDTASDNDVRDVRMLLRRSDAFVYAISIDAGKTRPINDWVNPYALQGITDDSGGYPEIVHDSLELAPATARIADELNHQYTLAYTPERPPDGKYHHIRVRVRSPDYSVRARRGYVATPRNGG